MEERKYAQDWLSLNALASWDMDDMIIKCRIYHSDELRDIFRNVKWDEIFSAATSTFNDQKVKSLDTVLELCRKNNHKVERVGNCLFASILGTEYRIEHNNWDTFYIVEPQLSFNHLPFNPYSGSKFHGEAEFLVQVLEIFSRSLLALPEAEEKARFEAVKQCNISKILLPKLEQDIHSEGFLSGCTSTIEAACGDYIELTVQTPSGYKINGFVDLDNYELVLERLPLVVEDPLNLDFYLPLQNFMLIEPGGQC